MHPVVRKEKEKMSTLVDRITRTIHGPWIIVDINTDGNNVSDHEHIFNSLQNMLFLMRYQFSGYNMWYKLFDKNISCACTLHVNWQKIIHAYIG